MTALILRRQDQFSISESAQILAESALEKSGVIARVKSPEDNEAATQAQQALKEVANLVERARKEAKQPLLDAGRQLDQCVKVFCADIGSELNRLGRLCGDYQAVLDQQRRAAEAAQREELERQEKARQEELAKAQTIEEVDEIQAKHDAAVQQVQDERPIPKEVRAQGQVIRADWEVEVTDIWALARCHPNCVKVQPLVGEIKALLNMGADVKGIRARRVTKADVRTQKAIEV